MLGQLTTSHGASSTDQVCQLSSYLDAKTRMNSKAEDYGDSECRFTCNDDVLMEILLCLPAKSLTRFKSVSKNWRSLISSDQLRRLHTLRHPKPPPSLLLTTSTSEFTYFHPYLKQLTPYNFSVPNPIILNSCNGLMLLKSDHVHYVYNPTTKQSRKLSLTTNNNHPYVVGLSLAFDPSKSHHYKIVCLRAGENYAPLSTCTYQIEVYCSESRAWKLCLAAFTFAVKVFFPHLGVHFCNNFIYWPSIGAAPYFDIAKNVIKYLSFPRMAIPEHEPCVSWSPHLQELNGHLYYCAVALYGSCESVQVWEMHGENDDPRWP